MAQLIVSPADIFKLTLNQLTCGTTLCGCCSCGTMPLLQMEEEEWDPSRCKLGWSGSTPSQTIFFLCHMDLATHPYIYICWKMTISTIKFPWPPLNRQHSTLNQRALHSTRYILLTISRSPSLNIRHRIYRNKTIEHNHDNVATGPLQWHQGYQST